MKEAEYKYNVGINKLVYKPGLSLLELLDIELIKGVFKLDVFKSFGSYKRFTAPENLGIPYNSSANEYYFSVNTYIIFYFVMFQLK